MRAIDLRQIKIDEDDFGLMSYDPAFMNTASCRSAITYIDGDAGILQHRGYPIEQLCEHSTYLEVAYLLIHGAAAHAERARATGLTRSRSTRSCTRTSRTSCRASATTPTRWACWSPRSARCRRSTPTPTRSTTPTCARSRSSACSRRCRRWPRSPSATTWASPTSTPTTTSTTPATSSAMMYKMTELKYEPDPRLERALDVLFILHADHEQNASTSAVRSVGSTAGRPLLGGRRRRRRALRPAARRRQRGGAADAHAGSAPSRTSPPSSRASRPATSG